MKIDFAFFRKGAVRAEHGLTFDMPALPRVGDKIVVRRPETAEEIHPEETFVVRRIEWALKSPMFLDQVKAAKQTYEVGTVDMVTVECEMVPRPMVANVPPSRKR
jgi:hypothetical protein